MECGRLGGPESSRTTTQIYSTTPETAKELRKGRRRECTLGKRDCAHKIRLLRRRRGHPCALKVRASFLWQLRPRSNQMPLVPCPNGYMGLPGERYRVRPSSCT